MGNLPDKTYKPSEEELDNYKKVSLKKLNEAYRTDPKNGEFVMNLKDINETCAMIGKHPLGAFQFFAPVTGKVNDSELNKSVTKVNNEIKEYAREKYKIELFFGGCNDGSHVTWKKI